MFFLASDSILQVKKLFKIKVIFNQSKGGLSDLTEKFEICIFNIYNNAIYYVLYIAYNIYIICHMYILYYNYIFIIYVFIIYLYTHIHILSTKGVHLQDISMTQ